MTDIDICSMALLKLGASSIESFDESSAEAEFASRLYGVTRDALMVSHPWNFTLREAGLERDDGEPEGGFACAFRLPPDFLRSLSAGHPGRGRGLIFRISGSRLLCDAERVSLTYQRRVDPGLFPPHFLQALVARLAAELCIPVTESTSRAQALQSLAQAELRHARLIDSQQTPPAAVEDFTLLKVRA